MRLVRIVSVLCYASGAVCVLRSLALGDLFEYIVVLLSSGCDSVIPRLTAHNLICSKMPEHLVC